MPPKRKIKAAVLVKDIRTGIAGSNLMEKHGLSQNGLYYLLKRLLNAGAIGKGEYDRTVSEPGTLDEVDLTQVVSRRLRRIRTDRRDVIISAIDAPANTGRVLDFSETGVKLINMEAATGEIKNFVMTFNDIEFLPSISFEAQCRWTAKEPIARQCTSGFQIITISDEDLRLLRQLMLNYFVKKSTNSKPASQDVQWIDGKWTRTKPKGTWLSVWDK